MHHYQPPGSLYALRDRLNVPWHDRAEVNELNFGFAQGVWDVTREGCGWFCEHTKSSLAVVDGCAPGKECKVRAGNEGLGTAERDFEIVNWDLLDYGEKLVG